MLLYLSYIRTLSKTIRLVWNRILILKTYPYFSLEKLVSFSAPCLTWCLLRLIIDIILWYLCFCISKFSRWLHSTLGLEVFGYSFTMGIHEFFLLLQAGGGIDPGKLIQNYELAEECLQTNYYGAKRTAEALIPLLQLSNSPRIVNVSSSMGHLKVWK